MRILKGTAMAFAMASMTVVLSAQGGQRQRPTPPAPTTPATTSATYNRADAEAIGKRLYKAILGREADSSGLSVATADIQRGALKGTIDALVGSAEFRDGTSGKAPAVILEQFYKGMLDRLPDTEGVQAYLAPVQRRQYATVIADLVNSSEFRNHLTAPPAPAPKPSPAPATTSKLDTAFACQFRVLELIHKDAGGRVLVSFDRFPDVSSDGQSVQGNGNDRWVDGAARPMTYRCSGKDASYRFSDGRSAAAPDARLRIPSGSTRSCQDAIRGGLVFDAAAISGSDAGQDWILGLENGTQHECKVEAGGRVTVVK